MESEVFNAKDGIQDIYQTETSTPTLSIIEFNLIKRNSNIYQLEMSTLIRYISSCIPIKDIYFPLSIISTKNVSNFISVSLIIL